MYYLVPWQKVPLEYFLLLEQKKCLIRCDNIV